MSRLRKYLGDRAWLIGIFAVALAIRSAHLLQIGASPVGSLKIGDAAVYDEWARQIAAGDWLGKEVFYQAPLYPYFLGTVYFIFGDDLGVVRLCQSVLGSLSCVMLTLAAGRFVSKPVGLIAGLMLSLYAPAIFYESHLQKSVLDIFFLCAALWLLSSLEQTPSRPKWFGLGLLIAGLSLTRENALVFVIAIFVWIGLQYRRWALKCPTYAVLFSLGLGAALFPVALRNYFVGGEFHLTTSQFGPNFFIGNNPNANGIYRSLVPGRGHAMFERHDAVLLAETAVGRKLSPGEVSAYFVGQSMKFIRERPGEWLALMIKKCFLTWNTTEIADTDDYYTYANYSLPLRLTSFVFNFGWLAPCAVFGMWVGPLRRSSAQLLGLMLAFFTASIVVFFVLGRYRLPLAPLLIPFAAAGVYEFRAFFKRQGAGAIARCLAVVALVAIGVHWQLVEKNDQRAASLFNIGSQLQMNGNPNEAIHFYQQAIEAKPDLPVVHFNLGAAFDQCGEPLAAVQCYTSAIELRPGYIQAHNNLGFLYARGGDRENALKHLRQALQIDPKYAAAHNNLGLTYFQSNQLDLAIKSFETAVELQPNYAEAHYNLGLAAARQGRPADALARFKRTVELNAGNAAAHFQLGNAYAELGQYDQAIQCFAQTLALDPQYTEAARNRTRAQLMLEREKQ